MYSINPHLLNCIRASLHGTLSKDYAQRLFRKTVEWDILLRDAQMNGIGPLLYYILKEAGVANDLIPEQVMSRLEMEYYSALTYNTFHYSELSNILLSFQRLDIQTIILKGAALAKTIYPDISLRPFGDIDLLIRDRDLLKAESELQRLGYEKYVEEFRQGHARNFDKYLTYLRPGFVPVYVDLHTSLFPSAHAQNLGIDDFWDRVVVAQIEGSHGLVLSLEDTVLHLCAHIFKHGFSIRLLWLYDLALMILKHGESLDWKLMEERAKALGIYRIMGFILDQIRRTLDISLPKSATSWLESCELSYVEKLSSVNESGRVIWYYALKFRSAKGIRSKLKFIIERAFPSRDYIMWRYSISNPKLVFFGYCYRFYCLYFIFLKIVRAVFALIYKSVKGSGRNDR